MVQNSKAHSIAKYAIMFAIIFVAMMIDRVVSFIPIGFSMAVCVLLVTLSFCLLYNKWSTAVVAGTLFGVASFVKEFIFPSASLQVFPLYVVPFISIIPRCIMGVVCFGTYKIMLRFLQGNTKANQIISLSVATLAGLVANTLLYLSALNVARTLFAVEHDGVFVLIYSLLLTNILPEYLVSVLAVPHVVMGVRKGIKLDISGNSVGE